MKRTLVIKEFDYYVEFKEKHQFRYLDKHGKPIGTNPTAVVDVIQPEEIGEEHVGYWVHYKNGQEKFCPMHIVMSYSQSEGTHKK